MGRSFESVRMGAKEVAARWLKTSRALKKEDRIYGQNLAELAKMHSSEAFYALDDPLEAAIFSVLVEIQKKQDENSILGSENSTNRGKAAQHRSTMLSWEEPIIP